MLGGGVVALSAWVWVAWSPDFDSVQQALKADQHKEVLAQTLARTIQESESGVAAPNVESAPISPASTTSTPLAATPPTGYEFVRHQGAMQRMRTTTPTPPVVEANPQWLDRAFALEALASKAFEAGRDWTFATAHLLPASQRTALAQSLTELGVAIEGFSGDYARIRVRTDRPSLEAVLELPNVLGIGTLPTQLKVTPEFVDASLSQPASELVPVFITLMAEDPQGVWRHELKELGLTVGAYDPQLRTYTANMPYGALASVASADFVMGLEPVGVVQTLHATAVPVMGADVLRSYEFASNSFTGITGQSVPIAVMDSGLNVRHLDIASGRSSICGANFYPRQDFDLWTDLNGHGTHVTGTILGAGKENPALAGMAPNVSHVRFAKVLNFNGYGSGADIRRAMDYLAEASKCNYRGQDSTAIKPLIVNMSLADTGISHSGRGVGERKLDAVVHANSQLYVVAQANAATQGFSNYGTAKNSLAVGAVNDAGRLAFFSSQGPTADGRLAPNVVGSGVSVTSAAGSARRSGYETFNGTSMAAPAVSGVAALLMEAEQSFRNRPALTRARLMASAIRPDAYLQGREQFPSDNSQGPGTLQNQYGLGLVSARASLLSRDEEFAWVTGSSSSTPTGGSYEYVDIVVPEGTERLDLVMTWDEQPADTLTKSVLNNLDLWLDRGADCTEDACGEYSSRSTRDNVEWLFISDPEPGTYRAKVIPKRLYGETVHAALAWTILRGDSTPLLNIHLDEDSIAAPAGGVLSIDARVSVNQYLASATTLHLSCGTEVSNNCLEELGESSIVLREDGIPRPLEDLDAQIPISLGEIAVGEERRVSLTFDPSTRNFRSRLYLTATAWNARSATAHVDITLGEVSSETALPAAKSAPANDDFGAAREISESTGTANFDLLLASREPGEESVRAASRSAWFNWRARSEGVYRFRLLSADSMSPFEASMNIYTGDALVSLDRYANKEGSELSFTAQEGTLYRLQVVSNAWDSAPLRLEWEPADSRPANDDFAFSEQVSGSKGEVSRSNEGATLERAEYWGGLAASVWYRWTAPSDGYWEFSLDSADLKIAVFSGSSLSGLRLVSRPDPSDVASIPVAAGRVYHIAVASSGAEASGAQYTLSWDELAEADFHSSTTNDQFANAEQLEGGEGSLSTPRQNSTSVEPGEPTDTGIGTLWWHWTAPESKTYTWRVGGTNAAQLSLFTGAAINNLSLVASLGGGSAIRLEAKADTRYSIALGRSPTSINDGPVGWPSEIQWGATPANDNRADATQLVGASGTQEADLSHATTEVGEPSDSVGYESLWWHWSAPSSGWYRFWIQDHPESLILTLYPLGQGAGTSSDPVASSERMWPASGRVEAWVHARSGDQYNLRVSRRPLVDPQDSASISWESSEGAPAVLGYKGKVTNSTLDSAPGEGGLSNPRNLVSNHDGTRLFATSDNRLLGLTRDTSSGALTLAQTADSDSVQQSNVEFHELGAAKLRWDETRDRLLAHGGSRVYDFELSADLKALDYSSTLSLSGGTIPQTPERVITNADGSLLFALFRDPDQVQVLRMSGTDEDALTLIQTVKASEASGDDELLQADIENPSDLAISADESHLYLVANQALVVFELDALTDTLSHVRSISAKQPGSPGAFEGIAGLRGLALDSNGQYLFVTGSFAPEVVVFEVGADPALPLFLDSVTSFHYQGGYELLFYTPYHIWPDYFGACHYNQRHANLPAIDVICGKGFYTAWWDDEGKQLVLTDYANTGALDQFGNEVPEFVVGSRQLAEVPQGTHVYLAAGRVTQAVPDPDVIHIFERANGRLLEESGNHTPSLNKPLTDQSATSGTAFSYQFAPDIFDDADEGDTLTYSATGMPDWLSFTASTRTFSGTPSTDDVAHAPVVITVTASDPDNASVSTVFALRVALPTSSRNAAPLYNRKIPDQTARADEPFSFRFAQDTFRDPDGDSMSYTASGLPEWLNFDASSRTFSGTPEDADVTAEPLAITLSASDGDDLSVSARFYLSVVPSAMASARISISSPVAEIHEWGDVSSAEIRVSIDMPVDVDQTVTLRSTGSATLHQDFELAATELTIAAGTLHATTRATSILDFDGEGEETLTLEIGTVTGGVMAGQDSSVSLALVDLGTLYANAKSNLYGDLNLFFSDRIIRSDEIEFEALIYNLGAIRTSPTTMRFWTSAEPALSNALSRRLSLSIPGIDAFGGIRATITVDLDDYTTADTYYAVAGVLTTDEELSGRAYTNEDFTGFTLDSDLEVITTCPDLDRNTSPGTGDPLVSGQWNLDNTGQTAYAASGGVAGEDLDMRGAIADGPTGEGVRIAVVDSGLEICHPDLEGNVESGASYNFNSRDWHDSSSTDPYFSHAFGDHGTSVAGVIASRANNGIGGRGVAPEASIRGYNYLEANAQDGPLLDSLGASNANPNSTDVDIFNMSFGSVGGEFNTSPDQLAAYRNGVNELRGGKGAIYVKAAGNGFQRCASMVRRHQASGLNINQEIGCVPSIADPATNLPYLMSVAAFNAKGKRASYSASGSSIWVTAPGGEYGSAEPAMITTDQMGSDRGYDSLIFGLAGRTRGLMPGATDNPLGDYVSTFNGTSASVPNASAAVALLLDEYPDLTWRDVKYILAKTARKIDPDVPELKVSFGGEPAVLRHGWITNAAGYNFHNWYGFGAISVDDALALAAIHTADSLGSFVDGQVFSSSQAVSIPDQNGAGVSQTLTVSGLPDSATIEAVGITLDISHPFTNDLGVYLVSPLGTESILLPVFTETLVNNVDLDWDLLSNAFYGESPNGDWTLRVIDAASGDTGTLNAWSLRLYMGQ